MIVTVFAKKRTEADTKLELQDGAIRYTVSFEDDSEFELCTALCDLIIPKESTVRIAVPKIEIKLRKKNNLKWEDLGRESGAPLLSQVLTMDAEHNKLVAPPEDGEGNSLTAPEIVQPQDHRHPKAAALETPLKSVWQEDYGRDMGNFAYRYIVTELSEVKYELPPEKIPGLNEDLQKHCKIEAGDKNYFIEVAVDEVKSMCGKCR